MSSRDSASITRRLFGSFLSALVGWVTVNLFLFAYLCWTTRGQPVSPGFSDALILAVYSGAFIFATWLLVLWPLYLFVPLRVLLWRWPICTFCGAVAGGTIIALFLHRVPDPSDESFPLLAGAVLAGGCTCLFGSLTASRFHHARTA